MASSQNVVAGIAWFRAEQWQLLRSLAVDADTLEQTHAEWASLAEKTIKDLAREGMVARKVDVDVNELQAWCIAQHRPLDASARAAYAATRLRHATNRPNQAMQRTAGRSAF